jgi:hypothetical protein
MATRKTKPEKGEMPREWLRTRTGVAEAADRWAKKYLATHDLSQAADIVDALAEAYEAGAAEARAGLAEEMAGAARK